MRHHPARYEDPGTIWLVILNMEHSVSLVEHLFFETHISKGRTLKSGPHLAHYLTTKRVCNGTQLDSGRRRFAQLVHPALT